jgi:hypothetical protein
MHLQSPQALSLSSLELEPLNQAVNLAFKLPEAGGRRGMNKFPT